VKQPKERSSDCTLYLNAKENNKGWAGIKQTACNGFPGIIFLLIYSPSQQGVITYCYFAGALILYPGL
jgi:hypothetical protein